MEREARKFVEQTHNIPPAPVVMLKLLEQCSQEQLNLDDIAHTVKGDPGLTIDLLKLCNSAALRGSEPAVTIDDAVMRLGMRQIHRKAMTLCAQKMIRASNGGPLENQLWEHSLATALAARQIGLITGIDENELYTAGLLHDIGKLVITLNVGPGQYGSVMERARAKGWPLPKAETERLGVCHSDVGGALMSNWQIPVNILAGVQLHHSPQDNIVGTASAVLLANRVAYWAKHGYGDTVFRDEDVHVASANIGLSEENLAALVEEVTREVETEKAMFQLNGPRGG